MLDDALKVGLAAEHIIQRGLDRALSDSREAASGGCKENNAGKEDKTSDAEEQHATFVGKVLAGLLDKVDLLLTERGSVVVGGI